MPDIDSSGSGKRTLTRSADRPGERQGKHGQWRLEPKPARIKLMATQERTYDEREDVGDGSRMSSRARSACAIPRKGYTMVLPSVPNRGVTAYAAGYQVLVAGLILSSPRGEGIPLSGGSAEGEPVERKDVDGGGSYAMSPRRKPTATAWALLRA